MVYFVDMIHNRACGANYDDTIDEDVFILNAAAIHITIPPYEKERRKHALWEHDHIWKDENGN